MGMHIGYLSFYIHSGNYQEKKRSPSDHTARMCVIQSMSERKVIWSVLM
jgi:hypothetical protein